MTALNHYLEPVTVVKPKQGFNQKAGFIFNTVAKNTLENSQVAVIGLPENRNSFEKSSPINLDTVRAYFYGLSDFSKLNVADLGNLKSGKTVKDTYASLKYVNNYLTKKGIITVFFGGSHDLTVPLMQSLEIKNPECTIIDARFDIGEDELHSANFITALNPEKSPDTTINIAGYQSYFVAEKQKQAAEAYNVQDIRLGFIRNTFSNIEPILRDSNLISFDLSAIRQADCPASTFAGPNGLYNEEACQLANLSGLSDQSCTFFVSEYNAAADHNFQTAQVIAQLMWHFIYGVSQRKGDYPAKSLDAYKKIYVKIEKTDNDLVFYQNPSNNRFWVEIPTSNSGDKKILSCSEKDYRSTCTGDIPDRIWKNYSRYF